jgi:hypothetical protein
LPDGWAEPRAAFLIKRDGSALCPATGICTFHGNLDARAAASRRGGALGKISTESQSAQGTFFFAPRYCRHWKDDPT